MIVVTGGTGKLGRAVVEHLLERVPTEQVGVSVRDPGRADDLAQRGVRVRQGSFDDPPSLAHSFDGASRVLVVAVNSTGAERVAMHRTAIEAAAAAGAERVLYTSHAGAAPESPFPPMPDHHATEEILRRGGIPGTALRNGFYAETAIMLLGDATSTGRLVAPEDGPVDWTTHADLAEGIAAVLADPGVDAPMLELTGPEAIDLAGVAGIASELTGRPIERVVVPDDEFRAGMVAREVPEFQADMLLGIFQASRQGAFARVSSTLSDLIGRPTTPLRDVLRAAIA